MGNGVYVPGTVIPVKLDDVTWGRITYADTVDGMMWRAEAKGQNSWMFLGEEDTEDEAQALVLEFWEIG